VGREGIGPWSADCLTRSYASITDAIEDHVKNRSTYWCRFCDKRLFYPTICDENRDDDDYVFDDFDNTDDDDFAIFGDLEPL
jgi:hypothetical protein